MSELEYSQVLGSGGVIVTHPNIAGGGPIFRGTRRTVAMLFEHIEDGVELEEIVEGSPTLDREDVLIVLREAHSLVVGQDLWRPAAATE